MRNPKFIETLTIMAETHDRKNHDYAEDENPYSNFEWAAKMAEGFTGIDATFANLIGVKWARLRELKGKGKTPNNEAVEDTQRDIAVYSALWDSYYRTPRPIEFIQKVWDQLRNLIKKEDDDGKV